MNALAHPRAPALTAADRLALRRLGRIFRRSSRSPRRRRLLFLALAAPGFIAVFATPLHRSLALLGVGALLFAGAIAFRARTEPLFVRAETAALWPPPMSEGDRHDPIL